MAGYYFRLPQITELTLPQQAALNEIGQIALSGGPGTGKSVVSLWRHLTNYQNLSKSLLLTYTTTLKEYLKLCCASINLEASRNVGTSLKNKNNIHRNEYDEIIIDEAQDLDSTYYEGISSKVSYGADDSQILYPKHCCTQEMLKQIFPNNKDYILGRNFRSTQKIMMFAKRVFPDAIIPREIIIGLNNNVGDYPYLMISNGNKYDKTNDLQNEAIYDIIGALSSETHNIAILLPWKNDVQLFEKVLTGHVGDFSLYYEDDNRFPQGCGPIKNVHITTFKSAKGLEFDTVIIPNFHKYNEILGNFNIDWKDYYVACTRARTNLYLISNYDMSELDGVVEKTEL